MNIKKIYLRFLLPILSIFIVNTHLLAQCTATISHTGTDTIMVNSACTATLNWGNVTVNAGAGCTLVSGPTFASASDGTNNYAIGDAVAAGKNIAVTYTAVVNDGTNNINKTLSFIIYVRDTTAPVLSGLATDVTVGNCPIPATPLPTVTDNCTTGLTPTLSDVGTVTNCAGGSIVRTWKATDAAGNTGYFIQNIFVLPDANPPAFTQVPQSLTVQCDIYSNANKNILETYINNRSGATAIDNCGGLLTWSFTWKDKLNNTGANTYPQIPTSAMPGYPPCDWFVDVTYVVKDNCGNENNATVRFAVKDNTPPTFANTQPDVTVNCLNIPTFLSDLPTISDNCGSSTIDYKEVIQTPANPCGVGYTISRTWTATDPCANTSAYTRVVTVIDDQNPTLLSVPNNITVACDAVPPLPNVTAADDCDSNPTINYTEISTKNNDKTLCSHYDYTITRKWTATDKCGKTSEKSYIITVKDGQSPSFTTPANITVDCFNALNSAVTGRPTAIVDNCDSSPKLDSSDVVTAGSCLGNNTITRTWRVRDACNNIFSKNQTITTQDIKKPLLVGVPNDITLECGTALPIVPTVTVKDSCDNTITPVYTQSNVAAACVGNSKLRREWKATDNCGNFTIKTQDISFIDTQKPVITNCPANLTLNNNPNSCSADVVLPPFSAADNCGNTSSNFTQTKNANITSSSAGDPNTIVNAITLTFSVPLNTTITANNVDFKIKLNNIDGEGIDEYFDIFGENNTNLGKTLPTNAQCGNSTTTVSITNAQINTWGQDGTIAFILKPKTVAPAGEGINDICPNANVQGILTFDAITNNNLTYRYRVNDDSKTSWTNGAIYAFEGGNNTVTYFAEDCSGNVDSCQFVVQVKDNEAPVMTIAGNQNFVISGTDCTVKQSIPAPIAMGDNCGFGTQYVQKQPTIANDSLLTFTYNSNLLTYFANDKIFNFTGVTTNVINSFAVLKVIFKGDGESAGEYFTLIGEDGVPLGTTVTTSTCVKAEETNLLITDTKFNAWAADGILTIRAVSNTSFPISQAGTAPGINPCANVTINGQNDGSSFITATLVYNTANPVYSTTGAIITAPTPLFQAGVTPEVTFPIGKTTVKYQLTDAAGNTTQATYDVNVADNTLPTAKCKNTILYVTPLSGNTLTVASTDVNDNSTDNCGIASLVVSPSNFNCADINSTQNVTLTVTDLAGNTATCNADVVIKVEPIKPTFSLGICGNDTLKLYANAPVIAGAVYDYEWSGPLNFTSSLANPFIPNVSASNGGTYTLTVLSAIAGSCYNSTSVLQIPIDNQPNTPTIFTTTPKACSNGEINLTTAAYTGKKVTYYWYKGTAPSGVLVDSTTVPFLSIPNPTVGTAKYYVRVKVDGCNSNPSASINVSVTNPPVIAFTTSSTIEVCEGENITLGTSTVGVGYKYQWSGPDNFSSSNQYPSALTNVKQVKSGVYTLIVSSGEGCESQPATISVNVKAKPKTPTLVANGLDCEGSALNFVTNITTGVSSYHWINPSFSEQVTTVNQLALTNLNKTTMKGNWRLYTMNNACKSDESNAVELKVNNKPIIVADYKTPACEGDAMQLLGLSNTNYSYAWSGPNNFASSVQNPILSSLAGVYVVAVFDQNGCTNFDDVEVKTVPKPEIKTIVSNSQSCVAGATDLKLTPTVFPSGTYIYQWSGINTASTNEVLTLPNATASVNGTYILTITDANGCKSLPYSYVIDVRNIPQTPVIKGSQQQKLCEGENILLELDNANPYIGTAISYKWTTPAGIFTTNVPSLNIGASNAIIHNGDYAVKVTVDGCESNLSGIKKLVVNTIPAKPTITTNSPLCEGQTAKINTDFINGAIYEWLGPNNFQSTISDPVIPNIIKNSEGFYKVKVIQNGCESVFSNNTFLAVNETPKTLPIAKAAQNGVCLDVQNPVLTLSIEASSALPGATYTWFNASSGVALNTTPTASLNYAVSNFTGATEGLKEFYVVANVNGCSSKPSIPIAVNYNKIPADKAFAGADLQVCNAESVSLTAQSPSIGIGEWTQVQGSSITIADKNSPTTKVNSLVPSQFYVLQWKLSNGACKDYSFDEVRINVNDTSIKANAGDSINLCGQKQINLNGNILSSGTTGVWTQSIAQKNLGVDIVNPTNPKSLVTGLASGNIYAFRWTLSNTACQDYSFDEVYITVDEPKGVAFAGVDFNACGEDNIRLNATLSNGTSGRWTSLGNAIATSIGDPQSPIKNLTIGQNKFVWAISTKACGTYSKDTVTVNYEKGAVATDDAIDVPYAGSKEFNPAQNDVLPSNNAYTIKITTEPSNGKATLSAAKQITYKVNTAFAGLDIFEYEICNATCPNVCSRAKINVKVLGGDNCTVPTIITPNDDGVNDMWEIPCLVGTDSPNNTVIVFNQWGDEVFRSNDYKNDWAGTYNNEALPAGTYYFVVNIGDKKQNGFLVIER
jgi:gliding motility-associated-like protein